MSENTKIKKVILDDLPKRGKLINWKASIGFEVNFQFYDISGIIKIIDYDGKYLYIKYLDQNIFKIYTGNFQKCALGKLFETNTSEFKVDIGTCFIDKNRNLTIISRKYKTQQKTKQRNNKEIKFTANEKWYGYECKKCGYNGLIIEGHLLKGQGCPVCCDSPQLVILGINSIYDNNKEMIPYIGEEIAKTHTKCSGERVIAKCSNCGTEKEMKIGTLYKYGLGCSKCGDGISYPNKLMYNVLEQLLYGNFTSEYYPNWCKYTINNINKRGFYDFYFELNNKKYIVEMDGSFHFEDNNMNGRTKEESKEIDNLKDLKAKENGIEVIRINCKESDLESIKNNILKSKLANLFDLINAIDWNKCEEFALSSFIKKACEIKRDNPDITFYEMVKILKLNSATIRNYLKKGSRLGWCDYDPNKEKIKNNIRKSHPVEIFKDNISLGIFESINKLVKQSENLFGTILNTQTISKVCKGIYKQHKGFTFRYI